MKILLRALLCCFGLVALSLITALWIYRDIPAEILEERYSSPYSKFVDIEGVRYHVRQEGQGKDVVLLHASFSSLYMWDGWVDVLSNEYRITRLDLVGHGLTGSGPADSYSTDELARSLHALLEELDIDSFHLVGTSSGGILAFTYAADFSEDVSSLTLINSAGLIHKDVDPNTVQQGVPLKIKLLTKITPRYLVDDFVTRLIGSEEKATPEVLQIYYDMLMREGNRKAILDGFVNYQSRDPAPWLRRISAPTFIVWSDKSILPPEEAEEFVELLEHASTQKLVIEGGGHALPISHSVETAEATERFWQAVDKNNNTEASVSEPEGG